VKLRPFLDLGFRRLLKETKISPLLRNIDALFKRDVKAIYSGGFWTVVELGWVLRSGQRLDPKYSSFLLGLFSYQLAHLKNLLI
jgi:hypothetical protein